MTIIRLIHLADLHLGFNRPTDMLYRAGEPHEGRYVRQVDMEKAVKWAGETILCLDPKPDVVVIAGDVFHTPTPPPRAYSAAANLVVSLTHAGIEVVIIDGNHDISTSPHPGRATEPLQHLGAVVINGKRYEQIRDADWRINSRLRGKVVLHALPHRALLAQEHVHAQPAPGVINVLLTHGLVQGEMVPPEGRTMYLPKDVLRRGWHYAALGDWHGHKHQPLREHPAYYSGSLEGLNFGEAPTHPLRADDSYAVRGILDVTLTLNERAVVTSIPYDEARPMYRIGPIDARHMTAAQLHAAIDDVLEDLPSDALVSLKVDGCSAAVHDTLDFARLERARRRFRYGCRIDIPASPSEVEGSEMPASEETLPEQWQSFIDKYADASERDWLAKAGLERIAAAQQTIQAEAEEALDA